MPPPILEVSHLPSAASFYATIAQPLGLIFLSASPPSAPLALLHFGIDSTQEIIFSVVQSSKPAPSYISLAASSPTAVIDFHKKAELAKGGGGDSIDHKDNGEGGEKVISKTTDFDGNCIMATYSSNGYPPTAVSGWQNGAARSQGGGGSQASERPSVRRAESFPGVVDRHTIVTESRRGSHGGGSYAHPPPAPERTASGGISSKAVFGTLLGAAAGAAFAYAMVRSESPEPAPIALPQKVASYVHSPAPPQSNYSHHVQHETIEMIPGSSGRSFVSEQPGRSERDIRPRYVAQYSIAPTSRELERIDEGSYVSERSHYTSKSKSKRRPSEVGTHYTKPLQILPAPTPSDHSPETHVSRRSRRSSGSDEGRSHHSKRDARESVASKRNEEGSYHSARSSHTESTIRPGSQAATTVYVSAAGARDGKHVSKRSKAHSKGASSTTTIKVSPSKAHSRVNSIHPSRIELPPSVVGSSLSARNLEKLGRGDRRERSADGRSVNDAVDKAKTIVGSVFGGNKDVYEASVAPSDSVSSVGSKMERLRLVDRMRASANYTGR